MYVVAFSLNRSPSIEKYGYNQGIWYLGYNINNNDMFFWFFSDQPNTGPKGVVADWRRYKQLETEKRAENERERLALAKKLALTCR